MRATLLALTLVALSGCSWERMAHHSPYDLNNDGVLDAVCPGTAYDVDDYHHYSWRSRASTECGEQAFPEQS